MRISDVHPRPQLLLLFVFGVFTFVPLVAFILGVRGDASENQAAAERPSVSAGSLFNTDETAAFDEYFVDALPFREKMVDVEARVDIVLGDSPNPAELFGRDGWMFLTGSVQQRCLTASQIDVFVTTVGRAERVVASTGRQLVVVVGPDKASVHSEQLGDEASCVVSNAEALNDAISPRHVMGWRELDAASEQSPNYFSKDTHWTPNGARIVAELIIGVAVEGAWQGTGRTELGVQAICTADLSRIIGTPRSEEYESFSAFTPRGDDDDCSAPRVPPPNIADPLGPSGYVAHDSFGHSLVPFLEPYFSSFTASPTPSLLGPDTPEALAASDVIIWESVQRSAFKRVVTLDLAAQLAVALRSELGLEPAAVDWDGSQATVTLDRVTQEQYVLVSLASGTDTAQIVVNGQQRTIDAAAPVLGIYSDGPDASFELVAGDVKVQIARINLAS